MCQTPINKVYYFLLNISFYQSVKKNWGSFQGQFGDQFGVGDHFRVGIIL